MNRESIYEKESTLYQIRVKSPSYSDSLNTESLEKATKYCRRMCKKYGEKLVNITKIFKTISKRKITLDNLEDAFMFFLIRRNNGDN